MVRNSWTYRKLEKVFTGTCRECRDIISQECFMFEKKFVKVCTRGRNLIAYYRPDNGKTINDKLWMMHFNDDGTCSLWL